MQCLKAALYFVVVEIIAKFGEHFLKQMSKLLAENNIDIVYLNLN